MFAIISYENKGKNNIIRYKIENAMFFNVKYLNVICFKKQAIRKIEKKLYKKIKNVVVTKNLNDIRFRKLNVIDSNALTSEITKVAFEKVLELKRNCSISIKDNELNNKEFVKTIVNKCGLINVITDNIDDFYILSDVIYSEFGVLLQLNNKNFNEQIGVSLDENYIWFLKSQRKFIVRQGSVDFNSEILRHLPDGIDVNDFVFALLQENGFNSLKLEKEMVLERNNVFYQINEENIKKFLDN